jgi:hypothetical protein
MEQSSSSEAYSCSRTRLLLWNSNVRSLEPANVDNTNLKKKKGKAIPVTGREGP